MPRVTTDRGGSQMRQVDGHVSQHVRRYLRVLGLVMEWGEMHQSELTKSWTALTKAGSFRRIAPLVSDNRE